ncbi:MAG TPA: glycosyltransferase family 4 protein [Egibacteraceae bacterium]|nr:glycosyltransferase family 4 protein [Egibacteraceae bacterium]
MVRTLWVTNDFPPRAGGIENYVAGVLKRLPAEATRVLASPWPGDREHDATLPYRVDRVGRRPLMPNRMLLKEIEEAAAEHGAEVICFGAAWPLGQLAVKLDLPAYAFTQGHEAGMVTVGLGPLVRHATKGLGAVGVLSGYTREKLRPWIRPWIPIEYVPPGIDTSTFHPGAGGAVVRRRHHIPDDAPLVVCVSRLVARKGQDVLVQVWPQVLARHPDARLLLVGGGPLEAKLAARIETLALDGRVILAGEVPAADLPAHHAAADLFAMPCRTRLGGLDVEGLGIVFLEAQACGVPVIAGDSGGAPDALIDGETGRLVDGSDPDDVAAAVIDLLEDPEQLRRMGAAGRAFVEQRFSWDAIVSHLDGLLHELATTAEAA